MLDTINMAKKLQGDYKLVFEKADMYSTVTGIDSNTEDDKMMNLYDLLMEAQHEGKPVEKIVGTDIETFCQEYFKEENAEKEKWYIKLPKTLYLFARNIAILSFIFLLIPEEGETIFTMKMDAIPFLVGFAIGLIQIFAHATILKPAIFKNKKMKPMTFYFIILILLIGCIFAGLILFHDFNFEIPALFILGLTLGYTVIYLIIRSIYRYHKYGTLYDGTKEEIEKRKAEKRAKKEFNAALDDEWYLNLHAKTMAKRYQRLNKKNLRKYHRELTFSEFAIIIKKEVHQTPFVNLVSIFIFSALILSLCIMEIINSSLMDGLIFGAIIAALEIPICIWLIKSNNKNARYQLEVIKKCEEEGKHILEFAKQD